MIRYFKNVGGVAVEAPAEQYRDGKLIRGYNKPTNEAMLLADGYVRYTGTKNVPYIEFRDGVLVELEEPKLMEHIYTKLQIRRAMRKLGVEDKLDEIISGNVQFKNDWNDALDINLNDQIFKAALAYNELEEDFIKAIIDNIEEQ